MGIKNLLKNLPGGDIKLKVFGSIRSLKDKAVPVDFDTGSLVYVCALRHPIAFEAGDYVPAVRKFHKQLIGPLLLYKWDLLLVFDGPAPEEKRFEHTRRKAKSGGI
eukprot:scaffold36531_cov52-Attheya_sp.AAC.1